MKRIAGLAVGALAAFAAWGAQASSIDDLSGYWTGAGSVALTNGNTERVKCAVTYKVTEGGTQIRQSMRCASADYKIDAQAELKVKGAQVSGNWEERTYSATGQVSGRYTGNSFVLSIQGGNFTASMNVDISSCKQQIRIAPQGLEVNRVSIALSKC